MVAYIARVKESLRSSSNNGPGFSEGRSASSVRPLHSGGSSVRIDEHTANTSTKWYLSRGQQLEEASSQGSVQSGIDFESFLTTALFHNPVRHAGDWEGVRPWPRPLPASRGPDGADDRTPDDEAGQIFFFAVNMAGVLLFARA